MLSAGGAGSDERAAAPILLPWMEERSARGRPSRESPAPHCAQVKIWIIYTFRQNALVYQEISKMGYFARLNFKNLTQERITFVHLIM